MRQRSLRWRQRPVASVLLRAAVFVVPILAALIAATAASRLLPSPRSTLQFGAWWLALALIALATLVVVDRGARRLLPLAALLKLTMAFPDRAPSRFKVAREAASVRQLQRRLAQAREAGLEADPAQAAETIITLISALGVHDKRTRGHSERVHVFSELLADELGLSQDDRDRLRWASLLHDIGKLVVSADILNKPGKPDDDEWAIIRRHPDEGAKFIAPLRPFLGEWAAAVDEHHEWYDGSGYPRGLSNSDISRSARIVAVADAFEVMTAPRSYRRALSPIAAREELARFAGTQFDPVMVRAFLSISLGRLRRAVGPFALLAPLPQALRLTGMGQSVAQVGAALGGAAVLLFGGFSAGTSPAMGDEPETGIAHGSGAAPDDNQGTAVGSGTATAPGSTAAGTPRPRPAQPSGAHQTQSTASARDSHAALTRQRKADERTEVASSDGTLERDPHTGRTRAVSTGPSSDEVRPTDRARLRTVLPTRDFPTLPPPPRRPTQADTDTAPDGGSTDGEPSTGDTSSSPAPPQDRGPAPAESQPKREEPADDRRTRAQPVQQQQGDKDKDKDKGSRGRSDERARPSPPAGDNPADPDPRPGQPANPSPPAGENPAQPNPPGPR